MAAPRKILICEDEDAIREFEVINLQRSGYEVVDVCCGEDAIRVFDEQGDSFSVAILDIMMPGIDGFAVCKHIREKNNTLGIIMLSAKSQEMDKVNGLMLGADDYITKPFSMRELLARVKANIRRIGMTVQAAPSGERLELGRITVDPQAMTVSKDGQPLDLTQREYELVRVLSSHRGQVFSREALMEQVWNYEGYVGDVRAVDVAIRRLREKLEDDPADPKFVVTRRGLGYCFAS